MRNSNHFSGFAIVCFATTFYAAFAFGIMATTAIASKFWEEDDSSAQMFGYLVFACGVACAFLFGCQAGCSSARTFSELAENNEGRSLLN